MAKAKITGDQEEYDKYSDLGNWQSKFESSWGAHDMEGKDRLELLFQGSRKVDKNVNSKSKNKSKDANNVYNVTYEIIETKVDTVLPQPEVRSKIKGWGDHGKMIENYIKHLIQESDLDEITDQNERITYVQGYSLIEAIWDPDTKHHLRRGEIKFRKIHPKQFIKQPDVYKLDDMDYFFLAVPATKEYLEKRYDVEIEEDTENYPELNSLDGQSYGRARESRILDEITAYYKDDDGDIGRFVYVNDQVLEHLPKLFYRRATVCTECGEEVEYGKQQCECGGKVEKEIKEYEIAKEDMVLDPISYEKSVKEVKIDKATGKQVVEEDTETIIEERIIKKGDKIPYYAPTEWPMAVRINTPKEFAFEGFSDVQSVRDQQDTIKKVSSKMEESILKGGSIVTMPENINAKIDNTSLQIIKGKPKDLMQIQVQEIKTSIAQEFEYVEAQKTIAKDIIGVTDSFQGQYDPSAKSGRAKLAQIQQTEGRLASSYLNKYSSYKRLFWSVFELMLAMYDETRPFIMTAPDGSDDWGEFNKYEFLRKDKAGEWYYNTDFLIDATKGNELPSDRNWIYDQTIQMASAGIIDKKQMFQILEKLDYPQASQLLRQIKDMEREGEAQKIVMILDMLKTMEPEEIMAFLQLSPEEQLQAIGDITNVEQ